MQLHEIKPFHKVKKKARIGRGGKRGGYSGKGVKGQNSRAGRKKVPLIRGFFKKYPKLKGYRFKPAQTNIVVINLDDLEKNFKDGEKISIKLLLEKRIIRRIKGKAPRVKILARGNLTKKFYFQGFLLSETAKDKIKKAGGLIKD